MSILNQPSDGLFNVLIVLAKCLVAFGPMKKEKLLGLCAPGSLTDQDMAKKTLRRWTQIGLFHENADHVQFCDELSIKFTKRKFSNAELAESIRQLIYSAQNNERFWEKTQNQSSDMCRLTAWMLAQDVHQFRPVNFQQADDLYLKQINMPGVERQFTNSTRWNGFTSWGMFLGFGRYETGRSSGGFIIDPTTAIAKHVLDVLPSRKELPVKDFIDRLAELVPVIDGGVYRQEVESKLRDEEWSSPGTSDISTSLSRSLLRLSAQGIVRLVKLSDSDSQLRLIGRGGRVVQGVTHVQHGGAK